MTTEHHAQALHDLATSRGITREYWDGTGQYRRASDDAVIAALRCLGTPIEKLDDAPDALRQMQDRQQLPTTAPIATFPEGEGGEVLVHTSPNGTTRARILLESGEIRTANAEPSSEGAIRIPIDATTPAGYHRIEIEQEDHHDLSRLLISPRRLPASVRGWGLFAPLYALGGGASGDKTFPSYSDLSVLGHWMQRIAHNSDRPLSFLGTLPLLACFFEEPFEPSPYSPISRSFWSELYVDPQATPEFRTMPARRTSSRTNADSADAATAAGARAAEAAYERAAKPGGQKAASAATERIDYQLVMRERRAAIEALLHTLDGHGEEGRRDLFQAALEQDDDLASYAAFRASVERHGTTWESWSERARSGTLRAGADYDGEVFRYHAYAQWLAREQMAAAALSSPAGFYLDLPIGSHGGGYDTWKHACDFAMGMSAGAPPDAMFEGGQNWGFPPLHPERSRRSGYACLRSALRHHFEHAAILRVDHVMGFHRMFCIPDGFEATDGVYVRYHSEELWGLLAIEAARARNGLGATVVGEDLGTVPDEVRREMDTRGALRMHVIPFELRENEAAAISAPPVNALTCLGTHDMESFAIWWDQDSTPKQHIAAFLGCDASPPASLRALLSWMSKSDATLVCVTLEDLWFERERQNLPGTDCSAGNWQRPFQKRFPEFSTDAEVLDLVRQLLQHASHAAAQESSANDGQGHSA